MTAPMPPVGVDRLVAWLRDHHGEFTEEALRDRLLEAGHSRADVEAAFEILRLEPDSPPADAPMPGGESPGVPPPTPAAWPPSPPSEPEVRRRRDAALAFFAALAAILGIPAILAAAGAPNIAVPLAFAAVLLALVGWGVSRDGEHPGVATGLGAALLLVVVVPVIAVVAVFGLCLVGGGRVF